MHLELLWVARVCKKYMVIRIAFAGLRFVFVSPGASRLDKGY